MLFKNKKKKVNLQVCNLIIIIIYFCYKLYFIVLSKFYLFILNFKIYFLEEANAPADLSKPIIFRKIKSSSKESNETDSPVIKKPKKEQKKIILSFNDDDEEEED